MDKSNIDLEHEAFTFLMNEYKEAVADNRFVDAMEIKIRLDAIREQYMNSLMQTRKAA